MEARKCRDCDPGIMGVMGKCLEHRAQLAEELLEIVQRMATGERIEACGEICETDPCLCCQARAVITKADQ